MRQASLTISKKTYSSWSLRAWLLCRLAGLDFEEELLSIDDPNSRAELLLLSPTFLVPCLNHGVIKVWDTLAIAEYLAETFPEADLLPQEPAKRAHCRAIAGEMHSGFTNLRAALPMDLQAHFPGFMIWAGAQADIDRVATIWRDCLKAYGGPFLFGAKPTIADAMYAPVCARFVTYDVKLDALCARYRDHIMALPDMQEWITDAKAEPIEADALDAEF